MSGSTCSEWERLTERLGFWIHLDEAYVTYHQSYVESVWWSLKQLFDRGLLYQGHKIVWWWAQGGTALSSGEVGQGYREVADPSVYVCFPLVDEENTSLLVWTTTPWTLPSNQFAAVHPELDYVVVRDEQSGEKLILAEALCETIAEKAKRTFVVQDKVRGSELLGRRYRPPFPFYYERDGQRQGRLKEGGRQHVAWRVVAADFVTVDSGTGVVHQAPAFGEVDYDVLLAEQARFEEGEGPRLICSVGPNGRFTDETPEYEGRWVKEADKDIIQQLREAGLLLMREQYLHEYPFCWRAEDDPLIQYPRRSWFIRTTQFQQQMLANNQHRSTGCPSISETDGSVTSWKPTSIGRCRANGIGARRCRSGSARRPARWKPSPAMTNCSRNRVPPGSTSGWRPRRPSLNCPTICACTSRTSMRSPTIRRSPPGRACGASAK